MAFVDAELDVMLAACLTEFGRSVTLRRVTVGSLTAATGVRAETTADLTVSMVEEPTDDDPQGLSAGGAGMTTRRRRYLVRAVDLTGAWAGLIPTRHDLIIDGTETNRIVRVEHQVSRRAYALVCEQEATGAV